jgi:hypothetical protein
VSDTEQSRQNCILCRGAEADQELGVVQVWGDRYWRMTTSLDAEVLIASKCRVAGMERTLLVDVQ